MRTRSLDPVSRTLYLAVVDQIVQRDRITVQDAYDAIKGVPGGKGGEWHPHPGMAVGSANMWGNRRLVIAALTSVFMAFLWL
jgi:hypothetical protein